MILINMNTIHFSHEPFFVLGNFIIFIITKKIE
jgi:hypothetical protein